MSNETNRAIVRRYLEQVWQKDRPDLFEEFIAEDVIHHGILEAPGLKGMKEGYARVKNAFPDLTLTVDEEIAEGDKVVMRWMAKGTHKHDLMGIPAAGNQIDYSGVSIFRLANARIVELWFYPDSMTMLQQLGIVPALQEA